MYEGIQCRSVNLQVQVREGGSIFVRAEQNDGEKDEKRERAEGRERNSRDSSARVRHEGWGRVTGKAAGSAGVCTTDTCLDSITESLESHSFLPIKTEKTDPLRPLASPPAQVRLLLHLLP